MLGGTLEAYFLVATTFPQERFETPDEPCRYVEGCPESATNRQVTRRRADPAGVSSGRSRHGSAQPVGEALGKDGGLVGAGRPAGGLDGADECGSDDDRVGIGADEGRLRWSGDADADSDGVGEGAQAVDEGRQASVKWALAAGDAGRRGGVDRSRG